MPVLWKIFNSAHVRLIKVIMVTRLYEELVVYSISSAALEISTENLVFNSLYRRIWLLNLNNLLYSSWLFELNAMMLMVTTRRGIYLFDNII